MNRTEQNNKKLERQGRKVGFLLTVALHAIIFFIFVNAGFKIIYPPPAEEGILLEFEDVPEIKPIQVKPGNEPKANEAKPNEEIKLAQRSEAQEVGEKPNAGKATTIGEDGDVEKYEPPREKPIDNRALFSSADNNKDTLAAQTSEKIAEGLKAGHPQGNTNVGNVNNTPTARLKGRNSVGALPIPKYTVNKSGKVVVTIKVDQYGKVISATPGAQGTTVQDKTLWEAAKEAALKAQFNVSSTADVVQVGTITYIFKLN
jgi:hypothetical protein